jgi:uncharacterized protein (TIGR03067 family)
MMRFLMVAVVTASVLGFATAQDDAKKVMKEMQGTYSVKSVKVGGNAAPDDLMKTIKEFVIKDDQLVTVKSDGKEDAVTFKIDPSTTPAQFDMIPPKDKSNEKPKPGVFKRERDELTIVLGMTSDSKRPTDFKGEGKDQMVMVLVKKK